jgi:hypothetical protein
MNIILDFLNQPILLTIITLTVGGYLFSRLGDRRAKRDRVREKAIELLEEVGNDLNQALSHLYGVIRLGHLPKTSPLFEAIGNLYVNRFGVKLRNDAYLKSKSFSSRYDQLTWEIDQIAKFLSKHSDNHDTAQMITEIQLHKRQFEKRWPLQDKNPNIEEGNEVSDELMSWTTMIWDRAIFLLSSELQDTLK